MSNELAICDKNLTGLDTYRMSTDAAAICKDIVLASAQDIQGKKYVRVEGWQAIAIAHGCTASARDVERTETGFCAIGEVRRMSDGMVLSTAEGFVGDDELKWGKRPEYARRAMAQTRAISRACRSAFAHVVVMMNAGLSTTPAEEVPSEGFEEKQSTTPPATSHAHGDGRTISDAQQKRFFAIAKKSGATNDQIKDWLFREFGLEHTKDITSDFYEEICTRVERELTDRDPGSEG